MIKKIVSGISLFAISAPIYTRAQFTKLEDSYGLAEEETLFGVIEMLVKTIASVIGVLAILMIVVAGIMYMTSGGDQTRVDSAKRILTFAIVGFVVALLAYVIVVAVSAALEAGGG